MIEALEAIATEIAGGEPGTLNGGPMTHPLLMYQIAKERNRNIMRQVARWRLAASSSRPAQSGAGGGRQQIRRFLYRLGDWLIRTGRTLQPPDRTRQERIVP